MTDRKEGKLSLEDRPHYFIIAGSTLQYNFVKTVKNHGFITHVFDYDSDCRCREIADYFHEISIDEKEKILEVAKQYHPVAVTTTVCEAGNVSACWVSEKLGLPYSNSYETALNTTNKLRQREVLSANHLANARYVVAHKYKDLSVDSLHFPVVVKPADRSAGRGISLVETVNRLEDCFNAATRESPSCTILVEELLNGPEYSVETISCGGVHHVLAITEEYYDGSDHFISSRHLMPARLSENLTMALEGYTLRLLNAFNIQFGACHIEVKLTDEGFKMVEIASRIGAWRDVLLKESYGIDFNENLLLTTLGKQPVVAHKHQNFCILKIIHSAEDNNFYREMKAKHPELIVYEEVKKFIDRSSNCLADSQGFYFIVPSQPDKMDDYLNNRL